MVDDDSLLLFVLRLNGSKEYKGEMKCVYGIKQIVQRGIKRVILGVDFSLTEYVGI